MKYFRKWLVIFLHKLSLSLIKMEPRDMTQIFDLILLELTLIIRWASHNPL
jgi:hypothetical protein